MSFISSRSLLIVLIAYACVVILLAGALGDKSNRFAVSPPASLYAQEEGEPEAAETAVPDATSPVAAPAPLVLEKRTFKPELRLPGVLQPVQAHKIKLNLQEYSGELIIKEIVSSGKAVNKGDLVLSIELEGIEKVIRDTDFKLTNTRRDLEQLRKEVTSQTLADEHELEKARQRVQDAKENLENYETIEWPLTKERSELDIKYSEARLKDEITELEQLEEMYKESELASKTKEIVLERARRSVDLAKQQLALSKREQDFNFNKEHPRRLGELSREARWSARDLEFQEEACTNRMQDLRQSLEEQEFKLTKIEESMANLRRDKEALTLHAPLSGVIVHGDLLARIAEGHPPAPPHHQCYSPGDRLQNETVVLTCYEEGRYYVRTAIPESAWRLAKVGMRAEVRVSAFPGKVFDGRLVEIAYLPDDANDTGKLFTARVELAEGDSLLRPGMTCTVEFQLAEVPDAIVIPANCLIEREGRTFCRVVVGEKHEEREIFVGGRKGDEVWVVAGLEEGDRVLPKE